MEFIADLHLHSHYSRATSKEMRLELMADWARRKGIKVLGTGDFTHPDWYDELKDKLIPAEPGLFVLKTQIGADKNADFGITRFMLTTEASCIYSKAGRVRKIHHIILAPSFKAAEKINVQLGWIGNLRADGRPILGADSIEILKIVLSAGEESMLIPGHIWTPWFSIFGSKSGFDSVQECFGDYSKYIYALETGLSSDPAMNWRLSALDKYTLVSFGDAHSGPKLGREATKFNTDLSYFAMVEAIKNKDPQKIPYTIEFFPEEGKYHYDGHRLCNLRLPPAETKKYKGICPSCGRPITIGVLSRVEQLADRPEGFKPASAIPYKNLIPLEEIIADVWGVQKGSGRVREEYNRITDQLGSEFDILLQKTRQEIATLSGQDIAEAIMRVRQGKVSVEPGYDGVFGTIHVFPEKERDTIPSSPQKTLF